MICNFSLTLTVSNFVRSVLTLGNDTVLPSCLYEGIYGTINVLIGVSRRDLDSNAGFSFGNNWVGETNHIHS